MSKYLRLNFSEASLYTKKVWVSKNIDGKVKKFEERFSIFKEPITVYQISNVIHSLFGERPVPTLRKVNHKKVDYYFDKAKESYLIIDNIKINRFGKMVYPTEFVNTNKASWCSTKDEFSLDWFKLEKLLTVAVDINGSDSVILFDEFIKGCNTLLGYDVTTRPLYKLREKLLSLGLPNYQHLITLLKTNNRTPLVNYFLGKSNYSTNAAKYFENIKAIDGFNVMTGCRRNNNNGIDDVTKYHGSIYIPINGEDVMRLKEVSVGNTTLLDGGVVTIGGVYDEDLIEWDGYKKVGNISTDKNKERCD